MVDSTSANNEAEKKIERKAFVLLSGGLDSTTCLYKAIYDFSPDTPRDTRERIAYNYRLWDNDTPTEVDEDYIDPIFWVEAISVNYGQRHTKELEYAIKTCAMLGISHTILSLGGLLTDKNTMLAKDSQVEVPDISYSEIKGVSPTYVPYRNGTMLSVLTAHTQKWINKDPNHREAGIYFGAHSEDAANWAYPDCTPEFIGAQANAIYIGSYMKIRLYTPLQWLMKKDIVKLGQELNVPFANTWSCYKGEEVHCGTCPTCRSRREAFKAVEVFDPTEYKA